MTGPAATAGPGALSRDQLFFWLYLLAAANGITGMAIQWTIQHGWAASIAGLFGVSAVVWVALLAGLALLRQSENASPVTRLDVAAAIVVGLAALVPMGPLSSVALSLAALYAIATSAAGSALRRASIIFLAITGTLIWGRLILAVFSRQLLPLDTFFVASIFGGERQGNLLRVADAGSGIAVAPGCSSLQGISIALVFWAMVNQWFGVRFNSRAAWTLAAALGATLAINIVRIGLMASLPQYMNALHDGWGWHLFSWTSLLAVAAICLIGARREIFAKA